MNVVIYARFSSHSQNEQSIEGQLKTCYDFAQKQGYVILDEYIDRALSGTTDNRPQFLKMIDDSNKKHFEGVLVYQLDRFARNRYDSATYKAKLKKNGVRVLSARENITDDASGILVEGLLESMAEYYSVELSQKMRRGMDLNAEKCLCTGGGRALGFKIVDRHFFIDEDTAPIVQEIFRKYASGQTVTEICESLNARGLKTSTGSKFNKNSLRIMLKNKRYIGIYTYKGNETPGGMPRIIDDELFYKVQDIMSKNKKAPARARAKCDYLLTTKLFCGHCKEMMIGISGTSQSAGKIHNYYICKSARQKLCNKKMVRKKYIEDIVIEHCRNILTKENIQKIAIEVVALCEREQDNTNFNRLQKLMKENMRKHNNLMSAIMECDMESVRKSLYVQVPIIEEDKKELERQIALEKAGQVHLTVSEIKFFLKQLQKGDINDIQYRKTLINIFVNSIFLYDDKITIIFNSGNKPVTVNSDLLSKLESENDKGEKFVYNTLTPTNSTKSEPLLYDGRSVRILALPE